MNLDFSEEQKLIGESTARFLREGCGREVVRSVLEGEAPYSESVWNGLSEMGLLGAGVPEDYGGAGAGYLELCVIAREVGAALAPIPFGSTLYLVAEALLLWGNEEQKSRFLPAIARGELKGALAVVETLEQTTPHSIDTAYRDGALSGRKLIVPDGGVADLLVVLARTGDGTLGMYLADLRGNEIKREVVASIDPTRNTAQLEFAGTAAEPLGTQADGWTQLLRLYDRAAVLYAFEQLGGAERTLDMAVDYAKGRFAFGRAIGSFQAIKHMLADMFVSVKLAEANCYYAAWALSSNSQELPLAAATARVSATQAFQQCARDNIQVHGGMGFTWEFDCHLYYRRSNFVALELGGPTFWEDRLVRAMQSEDATPNV